MGRCLSSDFTRNGISQADVQTNTHSGKRD